MNFRNSVTCNPYTSGCGIIIILFVGTAFLMGRIDYSNFFGACIAVAGAFGLLFSKDSKETDCKIPPDEGGKKE